MDNKRLAKRDEAYVAVKAAFEEMQAAQAQATKYGALISEVATRDETERLTSLFTNAQMVADLARRRIMEASRVYTNTL